MEIIYIENTPVKSVLLTSEKILLGSVQDALDLIMTVQSANAEMIILHKENVSAGFFDLTTGLAGEVLQKFVNYKMKLSVLGSFKMHSKNFQAFIDECNRGRDFLFVKDIATFREKVH